MRRYKNKVKKIFNLLTLMIMILVVGTLVSAGDFQIEYGGSKIFTIATSGDVNVSGTIAENGILLSDIYLGLSGGALTGVLSSNSNITTDSYFVGDGRYLTNIVETNWEGNYSIFSTHITWAEVMNGTLAETATIEGYNYYNATDFDYNDYYLKSNDFSFINTTTASTLNNLITIQAENITGGTIDFARLPSLINLTTLDYHNITGIPTCGAGEFLKFDGTDLSCVAESSTSLENVAYYNETNTWAETQIFSKDLNITGDIKLMTDDSVITRDGVDTTNISIDSAGNVIINLG